LTSSIVRVLLHRLEIAFDHLGSQLLAPCRVDAFADDAEWLVEADDDFPGRRGDDRTGHAMSPLIERISLGPMLAGAGAAGFNVRS
jgi:hypothetical protein